MTRITLKGLCTAASLLAAGVFNTQAQEDLAKYVDPMIGTAKMGHTYPGATVPFGNFNSGIDQEKGKETGKIEKVKCRYSAVSLHVAVGRDGMKRDQMG